MPKKAEPKQSAPAPPKKEEPKPKEETPEPEEDDPDDVEIIEDEDLEEELEEEEISDVDDAELLNRLEAKYGRLPDPERPSGYKPPSKDREKKECVVRPSYRLIEACVQWKSN